MKKAIRIGAGLVFAVIFAWLAFHKTDFRATWREVTKANGSLLILALVPLTVDFSLRVARWWLMLRELSPKVKLSSCFAPFLGSMALNNVLPMRAGDIVRTVGFTKHFDLPMMGVLGTVVIERLLDLGCLLLLAFVGLQFIPSGVMPVAFVRGISLAAIVVVAALMVLMIIPGPLLKAVRGAAEKAQEGGRKAKVLGFAVQLLESLGIIRSPKLSVQLWAVSIAAWAFEGLVFVCAAAAFGIGVPLIGDYAALATGTLSTMIPGTPGNVGTFEYFALLPIHTYGVPNDLASGYVLTVHVALLWLPVTVVGLLLLLAMRSASPATATSPESALDTVGLSPESA